MNDKQVKSGRIEYFDLLKGVAIFLVVMGHALTMCIRQIDAAPLFKMIGEAHMPIFFFISGYLTYKATEGRSFAAPRLKKRFLQLMVPFFCVTALWVLYFPHSHLLSPLSDNLPDLYSRYWKDGYWFTLCLFELFLLYWPLSYLLSRLRSTAAQVSVILAGYAVLVALAMTVAPNDGCVDYAGVGLLARFYPIFMMGVMAHRLREAFERTVHNEWWQTAAIVVMAVLWYTLVYPWEFAWIPDWMHYITRPLMEFGLMLVAISLAGRWAASEYHTPGRTPGFVTRYFDYLGHESLSIYLAHYFFLFPLTPLQEPLRAMGLGIVPTAVVAIVVAVCVIAMTLLAVKVIERSRVLALLLLGKQF